MQFPPISVRRISVTFLALIATFAQLSSARALEQAPARLLDRVAFEVQAIDDSSGYFVYSYRLSNSSSSRGAVAGVNIDLSAVRGTGGRAVLPSTGRFINTTGIAVGPVTDHVPIGAVTPQDWIASLMPNAILSWAADQGYATEGPFTRDSAAVGGSKEGFGLRSPYYPGIRRFSAEPTLGSCCGRPRPGSGEYPVSGEFRVRSLTVVPAIQPEDIRVETVRSDLQQVCGLLSWIADRLCGGLRALVQDAAAALQRGNAERAKQALRSLLQELDNQHGPGKPVNDNAYWLLKVNAAYLLAHL